MILIIQSALSARCLYNPYIIHYITPIYPLYNPYITLIFPTGRDRWPEGGPRVAGWHGHLDAVGKFPLTLNMGYPKIVVFRDWGLGLRGLGIRLPKIMGHIGMTENEMETTV